MQESKEGELKLLIVDSDHDFVEMLVGLLKAHGYEVCIAYTEERARHEWEKLRPELIILDTILNGIDTLALCREMRRQHNALVMIITEDHDVQQEVRCLEAGADDYLCKPFLPSQFLAHIRAVSRRGISSLNHPPSSKVTVGPLAIDSLNHEVNIHGRTIRLTPTESKILYLLAVNVNTVCTAEQIVSYVWGASNGDNYLVKAHIYHLRQKIEADPRSPNYVLTAPGVGYRLSRHGCDERSEDVVRPLRVISR